MLRTATNIPDAHVLACLAEIETFKRNICAGAEAAAEATEAAGEEAAEKEEKEKGEEAEAK